MTKENYPAKVDLNSPEMLAINRQITADEYLDFFGTPRRPWGSSGRRANRKKRTRRVK